MVSHSTPHVVLVGYQSLLLPFLSWRWKETNFSSLWRPFSRLRRGLSNSSPRGWTSFNVRWWRPRLLVRSKFWKNYPGLLWLLRSPPLVAAQPSSVVVWVGGITVWWGRFLFWVENQAKRLSTNFEPNFLAVFATEKCQNRPVRLTESTYLAVWKVGMTHTYTNKNEE